MEINKNSLMIILSFVGVLMSVIVHILHRENIISSMHGHSFAPHYNVFVVSIIFIVPITFLIATLLFYSKKKDHHMLPLLVTLTLTFSSVSTIAGGEGMVEYHFSIFMVVAILAYYENVKLLLIMTIIFILQHVLGFFISSFTPFVFGVAEYSFLMLLTHVIFLSITSGATIWQILSKKKYTTLLQKENERNQLTIEEIWKQISITSEKVLGTVKRLKESSEHSQRVSNQITSSIQQMASGADKQLIMAYDSGAQLEEMTKGVHEIASRSAMVVEASSQTTEMANEGKGTVLQTVHQINTIFDSVGNLSKVIDNLKKRSLEISEITAVISDISSQTNLLALNAAIEAARAGDHGKGFAVVAAEVKKLAEQSEKSVDKVKNLIKEIQTETNSALESMEIGIKEVKSGIILVNQTGDVFEKILAAANKVYEHIHETSAISEQISAGTAEVFKSVKEMTGVAKDTALNSESISKVSEKQLRSIEDINEITGILSGLVNVLNSLTLDLNQKS